MVLVLAAMMLLIRKNAGQLLLPGLIAIILLGLAALASSIPTLCCVSRIGRLTWSGLSPMVKLAPAKLDTQASGKSLS